MTRYPYRSFDFVPHKVAYEFLKYFTRSRTPARKRERTVYHSGIRNSAAATKSDDIFSDFSTGRERKDPERASKFVCPT
jgi:hypothetical protein